MTNEEMQELQEGDTVINKGSGQSYTIIYTGSKSIVAVRSVLITNPSEWEVVVRDFTR